MGAPRARCTPGRPARTLPSRRKPRASWWRSRSPTHAAISPADGACPLRQARALTTARLVAESGGGAPLGAVGGGKGGGDPTLLPPPAPAHTPPTKRNPNPP